MKNIYLIPTHKPSRLRYNLSSVLVFTKESYKDYSKLDNIHIYITSNEPIKDGWSYDRMMRTVNKIDNVYSSKIILTTDPQLIENGVQEIDDEFLEWFVNNPSCEFVKTYWNPLNSEYDFMIPKEEPQQEFHICKYCGVETTQPDDECYAKPKQKTVEEIAKTKAFEFKIDYKPFETDLDYREYAEYGFEKGFIDGTKCQSERMYSEEEVIAIVEKSRETGLTAEYLLLTEQFKKDKL
jgi:hypothetical protein